MNKEEEKACKRLRSVLTVVMEGRCHKPMAMPLHFTGRLAK